MSGARVRYSWKYASFHVEGRGDILLVDRDHAFGPLDILAAASLTSLRSAMIAIYGNYILGGDDELPDIPRSSVDWSTDPQDGFDANLSLAEPVRLSLMRDGRLLLELNAAVGPPPRTEEDTWTVGVTLLDGWVSTRGAKVVSLSVADVGFRLLDLFEGRRQLIVYRAFYGPEVTTYAEGGGYPQRACVGCSFLADQVANPAHLNARDTSLALVSRAPQADIERLKSRTGWELIPWYTLTDDFDADFGVDQWHGTNAFIRDDDRVFRTYFVNSRGDEAMGSTWSYLDITALGRQEEWEDSPEGYSQTPPYQWWSYHDAYGPGA